MRPVLFLPFIGRLTLAATLALALILALSCSQNAGQGQEESADDFSLVWEAWDALQKNYAAPDELDDARAAGGSIRRLMELGQLEPYPFLTDLGRMRGQVPATVPAELTDLWRATQVYRMDNPEVESGEISRVLIRGMMDGLPEVGASYLTAEQVPEARDRLGRSVEGSYLGIGARVIAENNGILLFPFDGSPAEIAGVEPGDVLLAVKGSPVGDATPSELGEQIRGEAGTKVLLQLGRATEPEPIELEVFRGDVQLPTIATQLLQGGIGYLRVYRFRDNTGQQVFEALERLNQVDMLALILDLRRNSGGSPDAAAEVAGYFLSPGGLFRAVEDRQGELTELHLPEGEARLSIDDLIIAVMVDGQTIGEAEAVVAALQEAGRATVVGVPSYGEGSDYSFIELSDGSALYLPTSRWYTPDGDWVGDNPIQPDIFVEYEEVPFGMGGELQFNAAYEFLDSQLPLFR